jgi:hypothetical protein
MIYVEGTADTILVKTLAGWNTVENLHGSSTVCTKLDDKDHCKGMVDERDVLKKHPYVRKLVKNVRGKTQLPTQLLVLKDKAKNNTLILVQPRLEEWIIQCAKEAKLSLEKLNIPNDPDELHALLEVGNNKIVAKQFRLLITKLQKKSKRIQDLAHLLRN